MITPEQEQDFADQLSGKKPRRWPLGRLGPSDDGELSAALIADRDHERVILFLGKPVEWLAMTPEQAMAMAQALINKARAVSKKPLTIEL